MSNAAGVCPRTLQSLFADAFGITPARYLRIRRLHQLRTALVLSSPLLRTVQDLCHQYGFSDQGRMAADYQALFGEFPHQTLSRPLQDPLHP